MLKLRTKVGICVPGSDWNADFGMCLQMLIIHILTRPMPGVRQIEFTLFNKRASLLPKVRQELLRDAIKAKCDYALFIDTDQTFPSNLLYALLRHSKPVVACNIATKSIPASPTARGFNAQYFGGDVIFTDPQSTGLQQVWRVGTGIMLIDLEVLKDIPKPWFGVTYLPEKDEFVGEDWFFCEVLEKHGVKIYIDHDISKRVGHMGKLEFTHDLVGEVVRQEAAEILKAAQAQTA